jgi:hypothetical protein
MPNPDRRAIYIINNEGFGLSISVTSILTKVSHSLLSISISTFSPPTYHILQQWQNSFA